MYVSGINEQIICLSNSHAHATITTPVTAEQWSCLVQPAATSSRGSATSASCAGSLTAHADVSSAAAPKYLVQFSTDYLAKTARGERAVTQTSGRNNKTGTY